MKMITKLEAKQPDNSLRKIRVAAYARVSTDSDEQLLSLEVQKEHYENYIKSNPCWEYAGLYFDEGISGTKIDKRESLKQLLKDCQSGQIDRIITKSISRLARNTVDCLEIVRKLTGLGIYLYFEKENIDTEHMSSELMLSILSSIAQSESRSISENSMWSIQKRFENGTYVISSPSYGYKNENGKMIIVPKEAEVIKDIFSMALLGKGGHVIANELTAKKIPAKKGAKWSSTTVNAILNNKTYTGDVIFQKTFTDDNFNRHKNRGEKKQYVIENHHEAIISHETFNLVHELRQKRKLKLNITGGSNKYLARYVFSGKLYCGNCHSRLKKHDRHKKDGAYVVWCCTKHIREIKCCPMKAVKEEYVKLAFLQMLNKLKATYAQILTPFIKSLRNVNNKDGLNKVIELEEKKLKLQEQEQVLSKLLAGGYIEMDSYYLESNQLKTEIDTCLKEKLQLSNSLNGNLTHLNEAQKLQRFVGVTEVFSEFKDEDFLDFVDGIVVKSRTRFLFILKCGLELEEEVKETWHASHMVTE